MSAASDRDELTLRYRQASAQDPSRPSDRAREAIRKHALMRLPVSASDAGASRPAAANRPRWNVAQFASVLLVCFAGLLVLQFDGNAPQPKRASDQLLQQPGAGIPPVLLQAPAVPAPAQTAPAVARDEEPSTPANQVQAAPAPLARQRRAEPQAPVERSAPAPSPAPPPLNARGDAAAGAAIPRSEIPSQAESDVSAAQRKSSDASTQPPPPPRSAALGRLSDGAPSDLARAAREGRVAELDRLIAQGAVIDAPDEAGRTPLMLAAISGHADAVRRLLAAGAITTLTDREGLTALQHAQRRGLVGVAALIEAAR